MGLLTMQELSGLGGPFEWLSARYGTESGGAASARGAAFEQAERDMAARIARAEQLAERRWQARLARAGVRPQAPSIRTEPLPPDPRRRRRTSRDRITWQGPRPDPRAAERERRRRRADQETERILSASPRARRLAESFEYASRRRATAERVRAAAQRTPRREPDYLAAWKAQQAARPAASILMEVRAEGGNTGPWTGTTGPWTGTTGPYGPVPSRRRRDPHGMPARRGAYYPTLATMVAAAAPAVAIGWGTAAAGAPMAF
jgi:hypothetical protein